MTWRAWIWAAMAGLALLWAMAAGASGGGLLLPMLVGSLAVACVASPRTGGRVEAWLAGLFTGPAWRQGLILILALTMIQLLPVELALLMAGDVLAYVEVVAAVGLIAANTRLKAVVALVARPVLRLVRTLAGARRRATRTSRPRPARRPSSDADDPAWAFA